MELKKLETDYEIVQALEVLEELAKQGGQALLSTLLSWRDQQLAACADLCVFYHKTLQFK